MNLVKGESELKLKKVTLNILKSFIVPVILYLIFLALSPNRFGSWTVLYTIVMQAMVPTVVAFSMAFASAAGIMDLSIGTRLIFAAMVGARFINIYGFIGFVVCTFAVAVLLGVVTGLIYRLLRIPSLVLSIGLVMIYEILTYFCQVGSSELVPATSAYLGRTPWIFVVTAVMSLLFYFMFYRMKISFHFRATGNNELVAKQSGINVDRVKVLAFVVGGVFAGIAAVMSASYNGVVQSFINSATFAVCFTPMMGMLIGEQIQDYCSLPVGIILGELSISIVFSGLVAAGIQSAYQDAIIGVMLITVLGISSKRVWLREIGQMLRPHLQKAS